MATPHPGPSPNREWMIAGNRPITHSRRNIEEHQIAHDTTVNDSRAPLAERHIPCSLTIQRVEPELASLALLP